jgi:nucleoside-diphosphate-sugar epimerase
MTSEPPAAPSNGPIESVDELEDRLTTPTPGVVDAMRSLDGDILILGVGGKMGPTLARLALRASEAAGVERKVIGVSSYMQPGLHEHLESLGITPFKVDMLEPGVLEALPDCPNVLYLCGRKFGSTGAEWATWATNVHLPGLVARRYMDSRIVTFSSGNIYPFMPIDSGGATESTPTDPVGEYAMSCLGRERLFEHFSQERGTRVLQFRLNYAVELRYGVPVDVATAVWHGEPVDVSTGYANMVWQGYANAVALQALHLAASPPRILNVTGPELVAIRDMALRFGELMGREPRIVGEEAPTALLSDAGECHRLFGPPDVPMDTLIEWIAHWVMNDGESLGKPTHYESRDGKF